MVAVEAVDAVGAAPGALVEVGLAGGAPVVGTATEEELEGVEVLDVVVAFSVGGGPGSSGSG